MGFIETVEDLKNGRIPGSMELAQLLDPADAVGDQILFDTADAVRKERVGDGVHLRGLVEFSNHCFRECHYCGIRAGQSECRRYRLTEDGIVATAREAIGLGYRTLVLQSGEDRSFDAESIARILRGIKDIADVAITLSVGERSRDEYALWRTAGADRYLMRFETSDPGLYSALHPGMSLEGRLKCLHDLRELGYQVGSGFLIGLPGQTVPMIVRDLLTLRELGVEMAGIGPFLPAPGTPLESMTKPDPALCYRVIALARLLLPWAHIPATTAMGTIEPQGRTKALMRGANVVMPNVTPQPYRSMYNLYPNKICIEDTASHCRGCIEGQITSIGRYVADGKGDGRGPEFGGGGNGWNQGIARLG